MQPLGSIAFGSMHGNMNSPKRPALRILVIDDNASIHEDFRKILNASVGADTEFEALESVFLGGSSSGPGGPVYEIDSALQGQEGMELVQKALRENRPYLLAFTDMRMPPGWDGVETAARIWEVDPNLFIVISSAYSDYSWGELKARFDNTDRLFMLAKPFNADEARQLARSLTDKALLLRQQRGSP